jgi:POT family proton-dependent oligopeptide transporter
LTTPIGAPAGAQDSPPARNFFGHPPGLSTLFFTELWERFSYYGMRALLLLFLVDQVAHGGLGIDDRTATAMYGLYTASIYISSMPGGWVADRLLGAQAAVFWGGVLITAGHVILAIAGSTSTIMVGLGVIVLGTGLLKGNASAMVGELYREDGARRDAAFTLYYMAINTGAMLGPLATAWLAQRYGWHVGFIAAAIGMACGLVYYSRTRWRLGEAGRAPGGDSEGARRRDWLVLWGFVAALALVALLMWTGVVHASPIAMQGGAMYVMVGLVAAYFAYLLLFAGLTNAERRRIVVLLVLVLASSAFWAGYEQAGSSLNLFAQRHTDRMIGTFEIPAGWFQAVPAVFVILLAPLMAWLWTAMAARGRNFSVITKFAFALVGMALGFLVMVGAAKALAANGSAGPMWLVLTYLLHTVGELALSPVGMSATTGLAPKRFSGQAMGLWFTSIAMGNLLASRLAGGMDTPEAGGMAGYFNWMFWFGMAAAGVMLLMLPVLRRWADPKADATPHPSGR